MMVSATSTFLQMLPLPRFLQPPAPTIFTLEITSRCHHRCVGCGNIFEHSGHELDLIQWAKIIEKLRPHIKALRITGGEPTLHRQFGQIMKLVDSLQVPIVLFTNGNWRTPSQVISILQKCDNLQGVLVSLHGADAASYRKFIGADAFSAVTENIRLAAKAGLKVATNTLLLQTTHKRLNEIAKLALSLGVSTVSFGRYYGKPLPGFSLANHQLQAALKEIANLRRQDARISLSNCVPACFAPELDTGERGCTSGITHCTIGPGGDVRPCTHTPLTLGYIQQDDIETLWQGETLNEWRQLIPSDCFGCAVFSRCRGGCRATAQDMQLPRDPLMTIPLTTVTSPPLVELAAEDCPRLSCDIRQTSYGFALEGVGQFVTLSPHSEPILLTLDGSTTVQQLQHQFGSAGLQLVGSLLQKRLVELV